MNSKRRQTVQYVEVPTVPELKILEPRVYLLEVATAPPRQVYVGPILAAMLEETGGQWPLI